MSVRGAKPKPTQIKLLRGTLRKHRMNNAEPKTQPAIPPCPPQITGEARREWRRISKELLALGLLTRIDRAALSLYAEAWGRWVDALDALRKYGTVIKAPSGYPVQSPYLSIANKAGETVRLMLSEFGLSPAARSRVHAVPPKTEPSALELLRARRQQSS